MFLVVVYQMNDLTSLVLINFYRNFPTFPVSSTHAMGAMGKVTGLSWNDLRGPRCKALAENDLRKH